VKGLIAFAVMGGLAATLLVVIPVVGHGVVSEKEESLQVQRAEVQAAREEALRLSGASTDGNRKFGLDDGPLSSLQAYLTTPLYLHQ